MGRAGTDWQERAEGQSGKALRGRLQGVGRGRGVSATALAAQPGRASVPLSTTDSFVQTVPAHLRCRTSPTPTHLRCLTEQEGAEEGEGGG
eukprot:3370596-Rhodomonas_salina.2